MMDINRNLRKFRDKVNPRKLPARVGWQNGSIYDSARPNYIRLHWPDGVQFEAVNDGCPGGFGDHVNVIEDPDQPGLLIASPRYAYFWRDTGYAMIKPHRNNHQWGASDWVPIEMRQFMPLHPSVSATGFTLSVRAGWLKTVTGLTYYAGASVDLTTNVPATNARFVRVCFTDAGALTIIEGDIVSPYLLAEADIPALPLGYTPNCVIRLYAGQTKINDTNTASTDLIDDRFTSFGGDAATADWDSISNIPAAQQNAYATTAVNLTLGSTHHWVTVTAACTIALPACSGLAGREYIITATADGVVVDGNSAETINSELTQILSGGDTMQIKTDGVSWYVI